ncbi:winged helix-turn-helix domain-containing protein [Falsiroseomonas sp. HW251]|uniref:winged helix-turn-helix domain-containing protein n=1 Tax=Falsiroseomonas sp. HW251 TaxID=3390998 RepID=UPI003D31CABA
MDIGNLPTESAYRFAGFVLEPARAALRGPDDAPVELRPKSFDVLCHLVLHAGRVVTREALLDAIWPQVTVGDEAITQCVRDIRRALGEAGPAILRTIPRRGYMIDAEVTRVPTMPALDPQPASLPPEPLTPPAWPHREGPGTDAPSGRPGLSGPPPGVARRVLLPAALLLSAALAVVLAWRPGQLPAPVAAAVVAAPAMPPAAAEPDIATRRAQAVELRRQALAIRGSGAGPWLAQRALFERATALDPGFAPGWAGLAFTYTNMAASGLSDDWAADLARAEAAATRALAFGADQSNAHTAHCAVLRQYRRLEEALQACRRGLLLDPTAYPARANVGYVLIMLGRPAEAEPFVRDSIAAAPPDDSLQPAWRYYLGMIDLLLDRGDHGVGDFRRAHCCWPREGRTVLLGLTAALALNGQLPEAREMLDETRARWPGLTLAALRADPPWPSREPAFVAQVQRVADGLALAGLD